MEMRIVSILAIVFSALALVPYGAHLLSLPNKIGMSESDYFIAQRAYDGWWITSFVLVPTLVLNIALTVMLRGQGLPFWLALAASILMVSTLFVFFAFTQPGNAQTQNWTTIPANWRELRANWEYSHAANALISLVVLCLVTLAAVLARKA
jgi:hypothetical protein